VKALPVNFVAGLISDNPLGIGATSFNSAALANLPAITTVPTWAVFNPSGAGTPPEVFLITAHTASATNATIVRAQQGTVAVAWALNTPWSVAFTAADVTDIYERVVPPATLISGVWSAAPTGFLLVDGSTHVAAQTNYPDLWANTPAAWHTGADLVLPNMTQDRVLMGGGTLGAVGGANTHTLVTGNIPAHAHTMAHTHTLVHTHDIDHNHASGSTDSEAGHTHDIDHNHASFATATAGGHAHDVKFLNVFNSGAGAAYSALVTWTQAGGTTTSLNSTTDGDHAHTIDAPLSAGFVSGANAAHAHAFDMPAFSGTSGAASTATTSGVSTPNTGSVGTGDAVDHTPKHLRVNWAIKT